MSLQYERSATSGVEWSFDAQDELIKRTNFLVEHLGRAGLKGYTLEISDSLDSLLAAIMAQKAVEQQRRLGHEMHFHGILTCPDSFEDPEDLQSTLDVIHADRLHQVDIKPSVKAYSKALKRAEGYKPTELESRISTLTSYTIASEYNLAVINSRADQPGVLRIFHDDTIQPLSGLTGTQIADMLRFSGAPFTLIYKDEFKKPVRVDEAA